MMSIACPLENSAKSKSKKRKNARKKAECNLGPPCKDHTDIISNLGPANPSNGHACVKISSLKDVSQESGHSFGKDSGISLSRPENTEHRTSEVINEDLATKISQEHPKMDMISATSPLENSAKSKKKKSKRAKRKAESKLGPQCMDQIGTISNLTLADPSDGHSCGSTNNLKDTSHESGHSAGKGSSVSRSKLENMEHTALEVINEDLATKFSQEHPKTDMVSATSFLENTANSKKIKMKRAKEKAESPKCMDQTDILSNLMDQTDILLNLSLVDQNRGHPCSKINNFTDISQLSVHSAGKGSAISLSRQDIVKHTPSNVINEDLTTKSSQGHPKTEIMSTASCLGNSAKSRKEKRKRTKKKAEAKLGPQCIDQAVIISNLNQANASNGYAGKGSAISLPRQEIMEYPASEDINEARNCVLADKYQIPQRRKAICPRRTLLVLDVNGLLADIILPAPQGCEPDTKILGRAIFKRPFFRDFLKFCLERFDVGIWSSRSKHIIDKVVAYLLGDLKHKLLFCWDMSYCNQTTFKCIQNQHKPIVFKELRKLWEKHDPNLPWEKGDYDESNTLLIDDSPYKAMLNPVHTGVFPYSYSYANKGDNSLGPQGDLRVYLEGLATSENVQNYVAQNPFGQGALDETDPHWDYYSNVLQCVLNMLKKKVTKL